MSGAFSASKKRPRHCDGADEALSPRSIATEAYLRQFQAGYFDDDNEEEEEIENKKAKTKDSDDEDVKEPLGVGELEITDPNPQLGLAAKAEALKEKSVEAPSPSSHSSSAIDDVVAELSQQLGEPEGRIHPQDTLILVDYDDTLLPSTWLSARSIGLNSPKKEVLRYTEELQIIETAALKFLSKALELGEVHLITNAEEGWIQLTAQKFMPRLYAMLPRLVLVSARTTYEQFHPVCPRTWKEMAFRKQIGQFAAKNVICSCEDHFDFEFDHEDDDNNSGDVGEASQGAAFFVNEITMRKKNRCDLCIARRELNVISLGDSQHEREALQIVAGEWPNAFAKVIKFVERPGLDSLRKQLELMCSCLGHISNYEGDLDLLLSLVIEQENSSESEESSGENESEE